MTFTNMAFLVRAFITVALLTLTLWGAPRPAWAQTPNIAQTPSIAETPNIIVDIQISGITQISEGEVFTQLASKIGSPLNAGLVTEDIKTLHGLGFFDDIKAEAEEAPGKGFILRFVLQEKPRITSLTIEGNTQIDDKDLFEVVKLKWGGFYGKVLMEESLEGIRGLYREKGYLRVKLRSETREDGKNSYAVSIIVDEAPRLYITDIRVKNTKVFSELEIQRMMSSAEVDCFSWASDSGVFDETKINQDLQIIVSRYMEIGYVRIFIDKPKITLINNPEFSKIIVELEISEGEQYFTGKLDIQGDILGDKQVLLDRMMLETGEVYNATQQNRDLFGLRGTYLEQGYAYVRVRPNIRINDEDRTVDVSYNIVKNEKVYIGRIEFQGNRETRDFVLRREFEVRENELYNGTKLRISQQNLSILGYFKPSLRIEQQPKLEEGTLDLLTRVEETQTGTLQASIGFSSHTGAQMSLSISKGNFLGRGQTFRSTLQMSQRDEKRDISVDFIEPHLFDSKFSSDTSVGFKTEDDSTELDRGTIKEVRGTQGVGYPILPRLRLNFSLSVRNREFVDIDEPDVRLRTFTTGLSYNTVNHPIFPTRGTSVTVGVSQIGGQILKGTTEYRQYRFRAQKFFALNEDNSLIFMARLRLGWLESVGDNEIPPENRFRLGGIGSLGSMRGYRHGEIGGPFGRLEQTRNAISVLLLDEYGLPVLDDSGQPIYVRVDGRTLGLDEDTLENLEAGGTSERLLNLELLFPLAGDNVRGVVFYDAGQVNSESIQYSLLQEEEPGFFDVLHSVGVGVRIITPIGVLRFEYGAKINPGENESPDEFDFTISTLF